MEHQVIDEIIRRKGLFVDFGFEGPTDVGFDGAGNFIDFRKARSQATWQPLIGVEVEQFNGIEIGIPYVDKDGNKKYNEYPIEIAKAGMWMMDHLLNRELSEYVLAGAPYLRIPLHRTANIVQGDALKVDWDSVVSFRKLSYILGNPPFLGVKNPEYSNSMKKSVQALVQDIKTGSLDYVCGWWLKAARIMKEHPSIKTAFVSSNSITQGIQPTIWMKYVMSLNNVIVFAHQSFDWNNRGAKVTVVIIGMEQREEAPEDRYIYLYRKENKNEAVGELVANINQYLRDDKSVFIETVSTPIDSRSVMKQGMKTLDNHNYLLSDVEVKELNTVSKNMRQHVVDFVSARDLVTNNNRPIIYVGDNDPEVINYPLVREKIKATQIYREGGARTTRAYASTPTKMSKDNGILSNIYAMPQTTSGNRNYLTVVLYQYPMIPSQGLRWFKRDDWVFSLLSTRLHMLWNKAIAGRLRKDMQYTNTLIYNTFVFPKATELEKKTAIKLAMQMLSIRNSHIEHGEIIRDLYGEKMPNDLKESLQKLDVFVEGLYLKEMGWQRFDSDKQRTDMLFSLYQKYIYPKAKKHMNAL
ncbi:DNA methyltransferase [Levilactobacillus lindianensis]|uniref:DNA methyltransferase n=1 Tax=Levilactobacillus lindianensis TaxID=2486018 RepID=UPI0013DE4761|nr:DNA methyltransferase [Levilactobacillus lindianensis]